MPVYGQRNNSANTHFFRIFAVNQTATSDRPSSSKTFASTLDQIIMYVTTHGCKPRQRGVLERRDGKLGKTATIAVNCRVTLQRLRSTDHDDVHAFHAAVRALNSNSADRRLALLQLGINRTSRPGMPCIARSNVGGRTTRWSIAYRRRAAVVCGLRNRSYINNVAIWAVITLNHCAG